MKNKKINILIIILLTILVLYFALKDNYKEIIPLLFQANILWLIVGYLFVLGYTFLKSVVTNDLIGSFKEYGLLKTFKLQLMTFFFNAITPFSTGGQPFQIYVLNKNNFNLTTSSNIVVQESIIHQIALSFVVTLTFIINFIFNIYDMNFTLILLLVLSFFFNAFIVFLLFALAYGKKIDNKFVKFIINVLYKLKVVKNKDEKINKWEKYIDEFNKASKNLLENKKRFIKLIMINAFAIICLYIVPIFMLFSLKDYQSFNVIDSIVLISFVSIISCYVPLPGGTIGQEYLFTLFFGKYVRVPILSSIMILWRTITYYLPMIVGAIIFNTNKKN